jgi:hypothetical protein
MNTAELLKTLSDAVTASGKSLSEIGKEPIFEFLKRNETPMSLWEGIYEKLRHIHAPRSASAIGSKVDYTDNSHNDVKHREPRKKVFSEIKKIAG